jgi:PKD repeat protein
MRTQKKKPGFARYILAILAVLFIALPVLACESSTPTPTPTPFPNLTPAASTTAAPISSWFDCNWNYRKTITIDRTKVTGSLTNFPILVSLAMDPDLSAHALANGNDILFTSSDGTTRLSHEIEKYANGNLVAWVKVPSVTSGSNAVIYLYYGNPGAPNQQDPAGVWDTNFRGVWHLKSSLADSTSHGNNCINHGSTSVNGPIADARYFAKAQYLDCGAFENIPKEMTTEFWVNINDNALGDSWPRIVEKGDENTNGWSVYVDENSHQLNFAYNDGSKGHWILFSDNQPGLDAWYHVAVTYSVSKNIASMYVNGQQVDSSTEVHAITANSNTFHIGSQYYRLNSAIDEVRMSNAARSAGWIKTSYANQNSPSTFSSLGTEVKSRDQLTCRIPTPPVAAFSADVTSGKAPLTVTFTDQSTNSPTAWTWDFGDGGSSSLQNPVHVYTAAGTYPVALTASNGDGSDKLVKQDYITVTIDCGDSYSLVSGSGETTGCVAITNEWTTNDATNAKMNTLSVAYTLADPYCLKSADPAIEGALAFHPSQAFDALPCIKSYSFNIPLGDTGDVASLYVTAHGVVQRMTRGTSSADIDAVVPDNPIYYIIQGSG